MDTNPLLAQLQQLDGMIFGEGSLFVVPATATGPNPAIAAGSDFNSLSLSYALSTYGDGATTLPGTLQILNLDYRAGYVFPGTSAYLLPHFGTVAFPNAAQLSNYTFFISGLGENGMLLLTQIDQVVTLGEISSIERYGAWILATNGLSAASFPITFETDPSVFCFAEGTRIETADGPVAVEDITEGTLALTASGAQRPIRWIGQLVSRPARHKRPWEVNPVRILPHAFGPNIPEREVRLSPGHSVFVDGVLVPVAHLVNGATIVQDAVEAIRYFHVELDSHDVLLSEGLPCESYLNDRGRQGFVNAGEVPQLHARLDPQSWDDACAPLVVEGQPLTAIRERLHAQAEVLGWSLGEDAGVMLEVDGATLLPRGVCDGTYTFDVPAARTVRLVSRSAVLAHVRPELSDKRLLGVAVTAVRVDGQAVDLDGAAFGAGFHAIERQAEDAWRWSDGFATLELALTARATLDITVTMVAPAWTRALIELQLVA